MLVVKLKREYDVVAAHKGGESSRLKEHLSLPATPLLILSLDMLGRDETMVEGQVAKLASIKED